MAAFAGRADSAESRSDFRLSRGFTLLELMLVISIVAIFAGLGVPSFSRLIANEHIRSAAGNLQSALWRARSEAIRLNRDVVLRPVVEAEGWGSGWVAVNPAFPDQELVRRGPLTGVVLSGGAPSVTYRASGRLRGLAAGAVFELSAKSDQGAKKRCVRIDPCGRPMMREEGC
jgi:type IV fimbrial biogenesis protein FimT